MIGLVVKTSSNLAGLVLERSSDAENPTQFRGNLPSKDGSWADHTVRAVIATLPLHHGV
jgi:hypothetical protein